jgi:hypothetical protein
MGWGRSRGVRADTYPSRLFFEWGEFERKAI